MKSISIFFVFGCVLFFNASAQTRDYVISEPRYLDSILNTRHQKITNKKTKSGFRVQVFSGTERKAAMELRTKLLQDYTEDQVILDFHPPYFKIKIGSYQTKLEAFRKLKELKELYPGAFIVADQIPISE